MAKRNRTYRRFRSINPYSLEVVDIGSLKNVLPDGTVISYESRTTTPHKLKIVQRSRKSRKRVLAERKAECAENMFIYPTAFETVGNILTWLCTTVKLLPIMLVNHDEDDIYYLADYHKGVSLAGNVTRQPGEEGILLHDNSADMYKHCNFWQRPETTRCTLLEDGVKVRVLGNIYDEYLQGMSL